MKQIHIRAIALMLLPAAMSGFTWAQVPSGTPPPPTVQPLPAPYIPPAIPASNWTPAQIRQSFDLADADSNGQLTRSEAQRLQIMPRSFEDMDQNKDGFITREEYEGSVSR
jgi:hypothetical protein